MNKFTCSSGYSNFSKFGMGRVCLCTGTHPPLRRSRSTKVWLRRAVNDIFAIELYFNGRLEDTVRKVWANVDDLNTQKSMTSIENATPHVSLAVIQSATTEQVAQVVNSPLTVSKFPIQFDIVGCFPTSGTLFLAPTFSTALRMIHEQVYEVLSKIGIETVEYCTPNYWNPHCTIGLNLHGIDLTKAFERTLYTFKPLSGTVVAIGAVEVIHSAGRHIKSPQVTFRTL